MKAKKKKVDTYKAEDFGVDLEVRLLSLLLYFRITCHLHFFTFPKLNFASDNLFSKKPKNKVLEVFEPPPRKEGILVDDVDSLIDKLKNEASVIQ